MNLYRTPDEIDSAVHGCAMSMGNFDGVHKGHAKIIERLGVWAKNVSGPSVIFTFDPHPVRLLRPELAPPPLTWTQRKADLLAKLGIDSMIAWPTDRGLLQLTYQQFFDEIVRKKIRAAAIVEGPNFFFGKDRKGDIHKLAQLCDSSSIGCEIVQPGLVQDELISSTRIRDLISAGDVLAARQMLTEPYRLRGMVVHGEGRGTRLNFPTANLDAIDTLVPANGVYAGIATVNDRQKIAAVHIGPSPTFGVDKPKVEVHLLDFEGSVYGQIVEVDFLNRIRGVQRFDSPREITDQLRQDVERARQIGDSWLQRR